MPKLAPNLTSLIHQDFQTIDYATSDHAYQRINVVADTLSLRALTWNTMDKCHAVSDKRSYSNNPMNIDETLGQYQQRKLLQVDQILEFIRSSDPTQPLDCIFLQETDWIRMHNREPNGSTDRAQKIIYDRFITGLKSLGWNIVVSSPSTEEGSSQQTLLTLYNAKTLAPIGPEANRGVFPAPNMQKTAKRYRGYQMGFKHVSTDTNVDLVNFHLNYEHDHRQDILEVMNQSIAKGNTIVMGGDANHPPNFAMDTLTGEWSHATAVDLDKTVFQNRREIVMTTTHLDAKGKNIAKHYDGFCAGSPQRLRIFKEHGEHFELNAQGRCVLVSDKVPLTYQKHVSEPGYPWMRGRALLVYLDSQLAKLRTIAEKSELITKMQRIAQNRFGEDLKTAAAHKKYPLPTASKMLGLTENQTMLESSSADLTSVSATASVVDNLGTVDQIITTLGTKSIALSAARMSALTEVLNRLHTGSKNTWNPYYMGCSVKLSAISKAINNLPTGSDFDSQIQDPSTPLYKALNRQRISQFTLFGTIAFDQAKSLAKIQEAAPMMSKA